MLLLWAYQFDVLKSPLQDAVYASMQYSQQLRVNTYKRSFEHFWHEARTDSNNLSSIHGGIPRVFF
jgi:hypothetical protein